MRGEIYLIPLNNLIYWRNFVTLPITLALIRLSDNSLNANIRIYEFVIRDILVFVWMVSWNDGYGCEANELIFMEHQFIPYKFPSQIQSWMKCVI